MRGAAAVEFAFIAPVLILLFVGLLQGGLVIYVKNEMTDVARDTARRMSTGEFTTQAQAESYASQKISGAWGTLTVTASFPSGSEENPSVTVKLVVPLKSVIVADPFGLFGASTLTAEASMRQE